MFNAHIAPIRSMIIGVNEPAGEDRPVAGVPGSVSVAALRVHAEALLASFEAGTPGLVADHYLASLDGEVALIVVELCLAGVWLRSAGGYRVASSEALRMAGEVHRQTHRHGDP